MIFFYHSPELPSAVPRRQCSLKETIMTRTRDQPWTSSYSLPNRSSHLASRDKLTVDEFVSSLGHVSWCHPSLSPSSWLSCLCSFQSKMEEDFFKTNKTAPTHLPGMIAAAIASMDSQVKLTFAWKSLVLEVLSSLNALFISLCLLVHCGTADMVIMRHLPAVVTEIYY